MPQVLPARSSFAATVDQVMPRLGLAFLVDDDKREWAVTKSTAGPGFESLECGRRVLLTVEDHDQFCLVSSYGDLS